MEILRWSDEVEGPFKRNGQFELPCFFSNKKSAGRCWERAAWDLWEMLRVDFSPLVFPEKILAILT